MEGRIHSIESFGTVDGPGIRFVVFMQGCPMRCAYCHNPDSWEINAGELRTVEDILKEYETYKAFLKGGGITVTGGEPLVQLEFVTELFEEAKKREIHTCLDTSGITYREEQKEKYIRLLNSTDLVMLDIKQMDSIKHKQLTGFANDRILEFAKFISEQEVELWVRYVAVPGLTDQEEDLVKLGEFLAELKSLKALDVLPYHTMGISKYEQMKLEYPLKDVEAMDKEKAKEIRNIILRARRKKVDEN
jgi:pyruvate formate lyase activating enzyme